MISKRIDSDKLYYLCPHCNSEWAHFQSVSVVQKHTVTNVFNKYTNVERWTEEAFEKYKKGRNIRGTCIDIMFFCEDCDFEWTETIEFYKGNIEQHVNEESIRKMDERHMCELWRD